jgi:hypothetical protein
MAQEKQGGGWTDFAGVILFLAGILNLIAGIAALVKKEYFIDGGELFISLQVWGWIWLVLGVLQIVSGYLVWARSSFGRSLALALVGLSIAVWFMTMGLHPWWSMIVIFIDGLVIYALTVFREQFE